MSAYRMSKEMIMAIVLPSKILYKNNKNKKEIIPNEVIFNEDKWNNELNKINKLGWKRWLFYHRSSPKFVMDYITKTSNLKEPVTQLIVE